MEELENSLFLDQVPVTWTQRAYPSLLGLSAWFADLLLRLRELESWSTDFVVSFDLFFYYMIPKVETRAVLFVATLLPVKPVEA